MMQLHYFLFIFSIKMSPRQILTHERSVIYLMVSSRGVGHSNNRGISSYQKL